MAKVVVICPNCLSRWLIDDSYLGSRGKCRKCRFSFILACPEDAATQTVGSTGQAEEPSAENPEARGEDPPDVWQVGDVILDVYEVRSLTALGNPDKHYAEGGMGVVYRVRHRGWDMDLAVKSPKPRNVSTERGKRSFERECETWVGLGLHPNIVSCYYVRRVDGIPRIFAEFVEGGTVADWMQTGKLYEGGPDCSLTRILDIAIQVAWGLDHAHEQGVIHQDVKPGNVMLQGELAKVTDFGLARAWELATKVDLDPAQMTMAVSLGGITPAYCSPEQIEAAVQSESQLPQHQRTRITRRTDIWSWGLTVFAMFFGKAPCRYGGQTAPKTLQAYLDRGPETDGLPRMPASLIALLQRCFQVDPYLRPATMSETAEELRAVYREVTGSDYPRREPVTADLMANGLNNRAASLLDLGKWSEAAGLLEEAWQRHPWQPQVTYNRGLVAWRTGQTTDTELVTQLEELCKMRPQEWAAKYALGLVQLERGEVSVAANVLRQAVQEGGGADVQAAFERANSLLQRTPGCVRAISGKPPHLTRVFLSANGRCALCGLDEKTLQLWEPASGRVLLMIDAPSGGSSYSPDGRWELIADGGSDLQLLDGAADRRAMRLRAIAWAPSPAAGALSKNGRWKLGEGDHYTFELREVDSGKLFHAFRGHTARVNSVSITSDGRWALSGGRDKTVRLWEISSGRCLRTLKGHTDHVTRVYLSPNGDWGLSESSGRKLHIWNLELLTAEDRRFTAPILLCDVTSSETAERIQQQFADLVRQARTAMDRGQFDEALRLADEARALPGYEVTREVLDLWNAAGSRSIRSGFRGAWCAHTFEGHLDEVRSVARSADGRWIVSASNDMTMRLWQIETGRCVRTLAGHNDWVRSVVFGPEDRWVLSASCDNTLRLWDLAQGLSVRKFEGHSGPVTCAAISADGRLAFSGSWDKTVRVWDVATGRCLKTLKGHTAYVTSVAPTRDGLHVLSGSDDKTIRHWGVVGGDVLKTFEGHDDWVQAVALSADGHFVLSGSKDRTLRLWDLASGRCRRIFKGHTGSVSSVALSADGRWGLSGSKDKSLRLWELKSGQCRHVFEGHTAGISCLFLSEDGRWTVSGGEDSSVRQWEIDWEYEFPGWSNWHRRASGHLQSFLTLQCPVAPDGISREGSPQYDDDDFQHLLEDLQHRGFGWLRPGGVRAELEKMAAAHSFSSV